MVPTKKKKKKVRIIPIHFLDENKKITVSLKPLEMTETMRIVGTSPGNELSSDRKFGHKFGNVFEISIQLSELESAK